MSAALLSGAIAGLVLSALQLAVVGPLIQQAETYEKAASEPAHTHATVAAPAEDAPAWEPADGFERTTYTVLGTVLIGIAYAAIALSATVMLDIELNVRRGILLGLAGAACFAISPAFGLPPKPPGVPGAALRAAQMWWAFCAVFTAVGVAMLARAPRTASVAVAAAVSIALPHLIGAPAAPEPTTVPAQFVARFAMASVATQVVFWLMLGATGGYVLSRMRAAPD